MELQGKIALVSGSSRGIGFAIAKALAGQGAEVIVTSRKQENLDAAVAEIEQAGGRAHSYAVHLGDPEAIDAMACYVREQWGRLDILVNNFGWNPVHQPLSEYPLDVFNKMLQYNLSNYFYTTRQLLPLMPDGAGATVINISSHSGSMPFENFGAYCIVKSGIDMMTRVFAKELASRRINVNGIAPGYVDTEIVSRNTAAIRERAGVSEEDARQMMINQNRHQRLIAPDEVAQAVLWLCGPGSIKMEI